MLRRFAIVVPGAALLAAGALFAGLAGPAAGQKPPTDFPAGCVGCHVKMPDGDHRLNAILGKVKGHPALGAVKSVPGDCIKCHKAAVKKTTFAESAHKAHFGKGAASLFNKMFKGECTHCHAMNPATGKTTLKSGPKNW